MKWTIHVLATSAVVVGLAMAVANGQTPKPSPAQRSLEVPLQQRVAVLEKAVQSLKIELAALRAQVQRGGSTQTPGVVARASSSDGARPSEAEINACLAHTELARLYGDVLRLEFGKTTTSQGGTLEMAMGAVKGTTILPTKLYFSGNYAFAAWVFRDSFGTLQCPRG